MAHLLMPATMGFLAEFCETRFDALCEHIADVDDKPDPKVSDVIDKGRDILVEVKRAARWAHVSPSQVTYLSIVVSEARRLWQVRGWDKDEVRNYVESMTSTHGDPDFVMREAYHDDEPPSGDADLTPTVTYTPVDGPGMAA